MALGAGSVSTSTGTSSASRKLGLLGFALGVALGWSGSGGESRGRPVRAQHGGRGRRAPGRARRGRDVVTK
eukprot:3231905-Alexandrium_andersonii.AAC.1